MQVRYQAALRPDCAVIIAAYACERLAIQHRNDAFEFTLYLAHVKT